MRWCAILLIALLAITSCQAPEMPLPGITGKAGELVVVMNEANWKGEAGDTVFNTLSAHVYGLPQAEPTFNVVHIKSSAFTKIFQSHRNILIANIGKEHTKKIEMKTDVWSTPQVVIELWASSDAEFIELFGNNRNQIIGHVLKKEQERIQRSYAAQLNEELVGSVKSTWGLKLDVPKGYNIVRSEDDFTWIRYETKDVTQSILVYSEPYTKQNTFAPDGMVEVMDAYGKRYILGPDEGTFMTTYMEYPPMMEESSIAMEYASRLVGLWNVEGAMMGGPFVTYAFLDPTGRTVFYLHGFVFAPGKNKRNYLRQVEAIIKSAQYIK